jgi:hypothetical protein
MRAILCLFLLPLPSALAQAFNFLPEIDAYYRPHPDLRLTFQAKETREAGAPTQAELGPGLDFFIKPQARLHDLPFVDPHGAESRLLQLSAGYRLVWSPDKPDIQRLQLAFTSNLPLLFKSLISDRSRADLDWSRGQLTWRYRNRLKAQRAIHVRSYKPSPYVSAEVYYQSQYAKWGTTALSAGSLFPMGKRFSLDAYYEHQNITTKRPNEQLTQIGLILNLYFGIRH